MLEVKNLTKIYKLSKSDSAKNVVALDHVDIKFPDKGMVFLLGKSGSGKSTLLNSIGGLDKFDEGEIIIKGKSSKSFKQSDFDSYRNTFIGFIFQEYNILQEFSVGKNLEIAIELQGKKPNRQQVEDLLDQVDLKGYYKRKPNQLSGGQKQRIAIARALIKNPEIIMADEPTGALDSNTGKQVMDTLKKLSKEKLVIIVSHDREFAEIYGDRIIELKDGKVLSDTTKKEIESTATKSGIKVIDNKFIHIPKGKNLTNEDLILIGKTIIANNKDSDTILSVDDKVNKEVKRVAQITDDGNREVFKETTPSDISATTHDGNNLKLIRSRLKIKDAFKIGASSLKHKPVRLIFTILLTCIALVMFGVVQTMSSFNRASAVYETTKQLNIKTVAITKSYNYYNTINLKSEDIESIKRENPNYAINPSIMSGEYFGLNNYSPNTNSLNSGMLSGMIAINNKVMTDLNLTLVSGTLPTQDDEVCISHIMAEGANSTPSEMINKNITVKSLSYKIVGVIQDDYDYSTIKQEIKESSTNHSLYEKLQSFHENSTTNMVYVTETKFNSLLESSAPFETSAYFGTKKSDIYNNSISCPSLRNEHITFKSGVTSIGQGQIVLSTYILSDVLGINTDIIENLNKGVNINIYTDYSGKKILKTFEVVGYTNSSALLSDEEYYSTYGGYSCAFTRLKGTADDKEIINYIEKYQKNNKSDFMFSVKFESSYVLDNFGDIIISVAKPLTYVAIGLAVFAGLLMMNFISTSIVYKKREIGILRAIGARGKDTFSIFYSESFVICAISFVLSTIITFITCNIINNAIIKNLGIKIALLSFGIPQILMILGINLLISVISTFFPVNKIARKNPIDSINNR